MALLEVKGLRTSFHLRRGIVRAVDDVSFNLDRGETLGIVGESGSGKSTVALSLLRLVEPPGKIDGEILFDGRNLLALSDRDMNRYRGRRMSLILQDPLSSLNPVITVGNQVAEAIEIHDQGGGLAVRERVVGLFDRLRISDSERRVDQFPHQLSGGMRQRVVGAISIACRPDLIVADEPTTALDPTVQLQYLNLLEEIQQRDQMAMIFITHDLGLVARICNRVAIMYAGRIVEIGPIDDVFDHPKHPYTKALLSSVPRVDQAVERLPSIEGQPPSLLDIGQRCAFYGRCADRFGRCTAEVFPPEARVGAQSVKCWKYV